MCVCVCVCVLFITNNRRELWAERDMQHMICAVPTPISLVHISSRNVEEWIT